MSYWMPLRVIFLQEITLIYLDALPCRSSCRWRREALRCAMISTKNPFPGMNPFLERTWHPVHTALITFIWQEISPLLPDELLARPEERLAIDEIEPGDSYRADVGIAETWKQGASPAWLPAAKPAGEGIVIAEPQILRVDDDVERWIEIRTAEGRLVTVIELLSPANKDTGRERYKLKQSDYLRSTANLVEIDLLRSGRFTLPVAEREVRKPAGTCYFIGVSRASRPGTREVYCCPLRERLACHSPPAAPHGSGHRARPAATHRPLLRTGPLLQGPLRRSPRPALRT